MLIDQRAGVTHISDLAMSALSSRLRVTAWLDRHPHLAALLLCLPALLVLAFFYLVPMTQVLARSFVTTGISFDNYRRISGNTIYIESFLVTFRVSAIVTLICLLLGYPVACLLTQLAPRWRALAFALILIPFWTSALVRTYAWTVILQRRGILNTLLVQAKLIDAPLSLSYSTTGTIIGNVHILLPMMILTLYTVLRRIDGSLVTAARTLGAGRMRAFVHVYLPLSIPAMVAGCTLTFVASLSSYIIPALLGGRKDLFVAQLIDQQVNRLLDVGFASAIAVTLLLACIGLCIVYARVIQRQGGIGVGEPSSPGSQPMQRLHPLLIVFGSAVIVFLILPTFVLVPLSFSSARYLTFPPPAYSLQWYVSYLENPSWIEATWRSLRIGLAAAGLASLLGTLAAIGLSRLAGGLRYGLFTCLVSPLLVPNIIYALGLYQLYSTLGLIGTETGLVIAHTVVGLPYVLITVSAALSIRDRQLATTARTLGATPVRAFTSVMLPLLRYSILAGATLAFIASFDEVVIAIFVSGSHATTLPKMMWDGATNEVNPTISAVSVIMIMTSLAALALGSAATRPVKRPR